MILGFRFSFSGACRVSALCSLRTPRATRCAIAPFTPSGDSISSHRSLKENYRYKHYQQQIQLKTLMVLFTSSEKRKALSTANAIHL
nr:hypothetical protein Q903MT_gene5045 [Picea sitchensis]